ncbi:MAG: flippase [Cyanobacteria bacterium SBLK]|nr:flippase [Cyanobacteria bacterium SBLK]
MTETADSSIAQGFQLQGLARDTLIAIAIRTTGLFLTYWLQVCLARWLGETQYGIYAYVFSVTSLLGIFASLGFPHAILRFVPEYQVSQDWGLLRGIIRLSWWLNAGVSLGILGGGIGSIWLFNRYHPFIYATPLTIGLCLVPLFALTLHQRETSRALGDVILAYSPYYVFVPILTLFGTFVLTREHWDLLGIDAIVLTALAMLVVTLGQLWLMRARLNREIESAIPAYAWREWLKVAIVLCLMVGFGLILEQTDTIMVGSFLGAEQAGIYDAAARTSRWSIFILQTIVLVAAPEFSRLYQQSDRQGLQQMVTTITVWIFWPSLLIMVGLILFSSQILSLFGSEFASGYWPLNILVIGQFADVFCGTTGFLMTMTDRQNQALVVYGTTAALNIILNGIGIPLFGPIGAAIATMTTLIVWNIWLTVLVVKYLKVNPVILNLRLV